MVDWGFNLQTQTGHCTLAVSANHSLLDDFKPGQGLSTTPGNSTCFLLSLRVESCSGSCGYTAMISTRARS